MYVVNVGVSTSMNRGLDLRKNIYLFDIQNFLFFQSGSLELRRKLFRTHLLDWQLYFRSPGTKQFVYGQPVGFDHIHDITIKIKFSPMNAHMITSANVMLNIQNFIVAHQPYNAGIWSNLSAKKSHYIYYQWKYNRRSSIIVSLHSSSETQMNGGRSH